MPLEDYANLTDADFEHLPPLVPEGEDREQVLARVIDGWATQSQDLPHTLHTIAGSLLSNFDEFDDHSATLKRVDLRDDNPGAQPIDLGRDLLLPLAERLAKEGSTASAEPSDTSDTDEGNSSPPDVVVVLLGCRIHGIQAEGIDLPAYLVLYGCRVEGYADFRVSTFSGNANFGASTFSGDADFRESTFSGAAAFGESTFSGDAYFGGSTFSGGANFGGSTFGDDAYFGESTFSGWTHFYESSFTRAADFVGADLRRAKVSVGPRPLQRDPPAKSLRLSLTDCVNWRWVRKTGELTALTRVSYLALVGVPLLAGLWGPARAWIVRQNEALKSTTDKLGEQLAEISEFSGLSESVPPAEELRELVERLSEATLPETMPVGWLLAFLAAFAVVVAQAVYQIFAPELIRQSSEDELVERANELNRQGDAFTPERLRQAIDYLHTAARVMPHRHSAWFVTRQLRTVWIPDDVDDYFKDATVDEPKPADAGDDWEPTEKVKATDQEVDGEDRKRIAIEEGERARFAVAAFEARSAAWVSGGLYLLAGWFSLMLVLRQLGHIAAVSPAPWLEWVPWVPTRGPVIVMIAMLIGLSTILGALLVRKGWTADRFEEFVDRLSRRKQSLGASDSPVGK